MTFRPILPSGRPTIIALSSPKGGVGKSTTCLMLGSALAHRGYKVLILDLDQNRVLATWKATVACDTPGLTVEPVHETDLAKRLEQVYAQQDGIVLLDVAGALDRTTVAAATFADLTITPTGLDVMEMTEALKLNAKITEFGLSINKPTEHRLLITRVPHLVAASFQKQILDSWIAEAGIKRISTILHQRPAYPETFYTGQPPHYADGTREPIRKAVAELDAFADEILSLLTDAELEAAA